MNKIYKVIIESLTPLNIGSGNKSSGLVKSMTIKDSFGKPFIPASTIKGLIKKNYRYLNDNYEEVFGKGGYSPSNIIVDDFKLCTEKNEYYNNVRFGNAIDRFRKVSKDKALYSREVVSGKFEGYVTLINLSNTIEDEIKVAIKMIKEIGSGKSIGYGKVKVTIENCDEKTLLSSTNKSSDRFALKFYSPLLIGGKQKVSNYIESDTVIKGSVVRAAFAKIILSNCTVNEYDNEDKKNWVYYREKENCVNCKMKCICKEFSNIKFSYFYPKDSEIVPLSAQSCKNNKEHGFVDDLIYHNKNYECSLCIKEGIKNSRLEFAKGLRTTGCSDKDKREFKVIKTVATKTAINSYTKTAADNKLYTIESIVGFKNDNNRNFVYEGTISGLSKIPDEELQYFRELRVGGDTTVGFGKCILESLKESTPQYDIELFKLFNQEYSENRKKKFLKEDSSKYSSYIAIKFIGDCKMNFKYDDSYVSTDKLKEYWNDALWSNVIFKNQYDINEIRNKVKVDRVYTELINYRGYSAVISGDDKREHPVKFAVKGSVIVFASTYDVEELYSIFNNICGFGLEQENGFGKFEVYLGGLEDDK